MGQKEIIGFTKPRHHSDSDSKCPNCGHEEWIGLTGYEGIFKTKPYNYYNCSECGCKWKVSRN